MFCVLSLLSRLLDVSLRVDSFIAPLSSSDRIENIMSSSAESVAAVVFTTPLPSKDRLKSFHSSAFQASYHNIISKAVPTSELFAHTLGLQSFRDMLKS